MRQFRLYPVAQHWWSHADYGAVLGFTERLRPERVLEFGPGNSTLALIEGGAGWIDTCEDNWAWLEVYRRRLEQRFPKQVRVVPYIWSDPLVVSGLSDRYDMAMIDGPAVTPNRGAVVRYCLQRCDWLVVALESQQGGRMMRQFCEEAKGDRPMEIHQTGPDAGSFALVGPPC